MASKVRDKNRRIRGNFVKAEDIAYWAPVTHEEAVLINKARAAHEESTGIPVPPFQMLSRMVRAFNPHEQ